MFELFAAHAHLHNVVEAPDYVVESVSQPRVVVMAPEVARRPAALPLPLTKPDHEVIAALRPMVLETTGDAQPGLRHYPSRGGAYLEDAAMAREIRRL
jgi:hypothetical protein